MGGVEARASRGRRTCRRAGRRRSRRARRSSPRRGTGRARSQNAVTASRSNGLPSVCAIIDGARARRESAASSCVDVDVVGRQRRRRRRPGTRPFWTIGLTVVGKPAATVITSSPGTQPALAEQRRGERGDGGEVRRRAGVDQQRVALAGARARARARTPRPRGRRSARSRGSCATSATTSSGPKTRPETGTRGVCRVEAARARGARRAYALDEREDLVDAGREPTSADGIGTPRGDFSAPDCGDVSRRSAPWPITRGVTVVPLLTSPQGRAALRRPGHAHARGDRVPAQADGRGRRPPAPLAHHEALRRARASPTSCSASATAAR